jgi:hypothetical protein
MTQPINEVKSCRAMHVTPVSRDKIMQSGAGKQAGARLTLAVAGWLAPAGTFLLCFTSSDDVAQSSHSALQQ